MLFQIKTWGGLSHHNGVAHIVCPECKKEEWKPARFMARTLGKDAPLEEHGYRCVLCGCKKGYMRPYVAAFRQKPSENVKKML